MQDTTITCNFVYLLYEAPTEHCPAVPVAAFIDKDTATAYMQKLNEQDDTYTPVARSIERVPLLDYRDI